MNLYEQWLQKADDIGLSVVENVPFESHAKGLICGDCIGLNQNIETTAEKACVLAEEVGHYETSVGNILNMSDSWKRKQERQARLYGYNQMIGLIGIVNAYEAGCSAPHEMAEFLNVTEEYLLECIECYREKYGIMKQIDNYVIYFIPHLGIMKLV